MATDVFGRGSAIRTNHIIAVAFGRLAPGGSQTPVPRNDTRTQARVIPTASPIRIAVVVLSKGVRDEMEERSHTAQSKENHSLTVTSEY
jgi:hypothetical protein